MQTTAGQILVNEALPDELRDYNRVLDKRGLQLLLEQLARSHPEAYRAVTQRLSQLGWRAAQRSGGFSLGMRHLRKSEYARALGQKLQGRLAVLLNDDQLSDKQREDAIIRVVGENIKTQQEGVYEESLKENNPLAQQVRSGARGNKMNLNSLRGSDLLYADQRDNVVPVPVMHSYSEGLTPWEYWAGTYGARKGVVDLKLMTQKAGYLGKQLNQITHRLLVTGADSEEEPDTLRGLPVDTEDADNEGALLAHDLGPYKRNTVLTPKILRHLTDLGHKRALVRSPLVGGAKDGGLYARDVGVRERGTLVGIGELPGMAAAQALSEPLTQGAISSKHTGGVAGEGAAISGFDYVNRLVQVPRQAVGAAIHAERDGVVSRIEPAPAGGQFVVLDGEQHYVPADTALRVKVGQQIEAGDVLSDGLPNPAKVVAHKGIGEGRRYFVKTFRDAMTVAGLRAHRRNIELLARGLIDHVRLTEELDEGVPDDVVSYSSIERSWRPRADAKKLKPSLAQGKYLERPALHYTIGTKLRSSAVRELESFGVPEVTVHDQPLPFEPEMLRGASNLAHDPDWMTRMYGSGLKGSLLSGTHRGATSDELGTSFVPGLSRAVDFGHVGKFRPPQPGLPVPGDREDFMPLRKAAALSGVPGDGQDLQWGKEQAPGTSPAPSTSPAPGVSHAVGSVAPAVSPKLSIKPAPPVNPAAEPYGPPVQPAAPQATRPAPATPYGPPEPPTLLQHPFVQMMLPQLNQMGALGPLALMSIANPKLMGMLFPDLAQQEQAAGSDGAVPAQAGAPAAPVAPASAPGASPGPAAAVPQVVPPAGGVDWGRVGQTVAGAGAEATGRYGLAPVVQRQLIKRVGQNVLTRATGGATGVLTSPLDLSPVYRAGQTIGHELGLTDSRPDPSNVSTQWNRAAVLPGVRRLGQWAARHVGQAAGQAWNAGRTAMGLTRAASPVVSRVARIGGRAVPVVGEGLAMLNDVSEGYNQARTQGYSRWAAPFVGQRLLSDETSRVNMDPNRSYAGQAWHNLGRSSPQLIASGWREGIGGLADVWQANQSTNVVNTKAKQVAEAVSRYGTQEAPLSKQYEMKQVAVPRQGLSRVGKWMGLVSPNYQLRYQSRTDPAQALTTAQLPAWAQTANRLRATGMHYFVGPNTSPVLLKQLDAMPVNVQRAVAAQLAQERGIQMPGLGQVPVVDSQRTAAAVAALKAQGL